MAKVYRIKFIWKFRSNREREGGGGGGVSTSTPPPPIHRSWHIFNNNDDNIIIILFIQEAQLKVHSIFPGDLFFRKKIWKTVRRIDPPYAEQNTWSSFSKLIDFHPRPRVSLKSPPPKCTCPSPTPPPPPPAPHQWTNVYVRFRKFPSVELSTGF